MGSKWERGGGTSDAAVRGNALPHARVQATGRPPTPGDGIRVTLKALSHL